MNDRDLTIALYRDGLPARIIKQKMQLTTEQYREYLADEPKREPKPRDEPRKSGYKINKPDSPARKAGLVMLREGATVTEVIEQLSYMGLSAHESTVSRWKLEVRGPVNCRVPQSLYPELRQIIADNPKAKGAEISQMYNQRTGLRLDRRAAQHWCKKVRESA